MNIMFLVNDVISEESGITKKIRSQASSFKKMASNFYFVNSVNDEKGFYRSINEVSLFERGTVFNKYFFRYKFKNLEKYILNENIDLLYIRYTHFASPSFITFIKSMSNNGVKVVLEFPTFPYDHEYQRLSLPSKIKNFIDRLFRDKMHLYINKCVTFTPVDFNILDIDTYLVSNAVDSNLVKYRRSVIDSEVKELSDTIVMTCVSSLYSWHGYDRIIKSLARYYEKNKEREVILNIVGTGVEHAALKNLTSQLKLNDKVLFHGELFEDDLDNILFKSDIGIDSLGRHRSGNIYNNSLKSKEYLSYGLPIVKSHKDSSVDNFDFCYDVAASDEEFDIGTIIDWYDKGGFKNKKQDINQLCFENYTWAVQVKKILEFSFND